MPEVDIIDMLLLLNSYRYLGFTQWRFDLPTGIFHVLSRTPQRFGRVLAILPFGSALAVYEHIKENMKGDTHEQPSTDNV